MEGIESLFDPDLQLYLSQHMDPQEFERLNSYLGQMVQMRGNGGAEQIANWTTLSNPDEQLEFAVLANKATAIFMNLIQNNRQQP